MAMGVVMANLSRAAMDGLLIRDRDSTRVEGTRVVISSRDSRTSRTRLCRWSRSNCPGFCESWKRLAVRSCRNVVDEIGRQNVQGLSVFSVWDMLFYLKMTGLG